MTPSVTGPAHPATPQGHPASLWTLSLGSIGVVFGDIGTSPLYALKESLKAAKGEGVLADTAILGVVSLILWTLIVVVTLKYVLLIMRMDNKGEGGTLALMALIQRVSRRNAFPVTLTLLGIAGASLFYGDAIITPAISVLSAVEGLKLVAPGLEAAIVPISVAIMLALFMVQAGGTARIATYFGPITLVWFIVLAIGGLMHIADQPMILAAFNPAYGVSFLANNGEAGLLALGAVFLAVTGAEALYADMGHFGRRPIQISWLVLVLPALALNYLGQGASLLAHPEKLENPFYLLYPGWALVPVLILATAATIIASQAVITGAFSLTQQAMQLGLLPRMKVLRTSETERGQIYIPRLNWLLLVSVIILIVIFRTSSDLASAYGIAVTGTMVITAIMAYFVMWKVWKWSPLRAALVILPFLVIDAVFLGANLLKVVEGGWLPLAISVALIILMVTWRRGSRILAGKALKDEVGLDTFVHSLEKRPPARVAGTAIFLTGNADNVPSALLHNLKHNKVVHERNIVLQIVTRETPRVDSEDRATLETISDTFSRATLNFGFMETPNIPDALPALARLGPAIDIKTTSFFLSRRALKPADDSPMPAWQDKLFIGLARTAHDASQYFSIPASRAVEIGTQISM